MANPNLLIDTSILIDHLRKQVRSNSILYNIADQYELYVSTIIEFELYMGAINEEKHQDIRTVLSWCTSLPLTSQIAQRAGMIHRELKQNNQLIEIRDMLISATALTHNLPVMTLNAKHFERVSGLRLVTPPNTS